MDKTMDKTTDKTLYKQDDGQDNGQANEAFNIIYLSLNHTCMNNKWVTSLEVILLHEEIHLKSFYCCMDKTSHLTRFCA